MHASNRATGIGKEPVNVIEFVFVVVLILIIQFSVTFVEPVGEAQFKHLAEPPPKLQPQFSQPQLAQSQFVKSLPQFPQFQQLVE